MLLISFYDTAHQEGHANTIEGAEFFRVAGRKEAFFAVGNKSKQKDWRCVNRILEGKKLTYCMYLMFSPFASKLCHVPCSIYSVFSFWRVWVGIVLSLSRCIVKLSVFLRVSFGEFSSGTSHQKQV